MARPANTVRDCPCGSGLRYRACCAPLHEGEAAASPGALMRSRYSAFSLGLGAYLYDTLAASHPDREAPREAMARELSRVRDERRFMGLTILHASATGDEGEVLFYARVFAKGTNVSFAELSRFVREDGAWRYASGVLVPGDALPGEVSTIDREGFLLIASALGPDGVA